VRGGCGGVSTGAVRGALRLAESAGLSPLRYRPALCGARCAIDRRRARRAAAVWVAGSSN